MRRVARGGGRRGGGGGGGVVRLCEEGEGGKGEYLVGLARGGVGRELDAGRICLVGRLGRGVGRG